MFLGVFGAQTHPLLSLLLLLVLFLLYLPVACCYFSLGDKVTDNIVLAMSSGWVKVTVEIMLLLHLISAFPIITNPPAQFFEGFLGIPAGQVTT